MRVLVVKMSSMGDVVHAQPLAADLRRHYPDATIDWVAENAFAAIPRLNPAVREVIPIAWRKWRRNLGDPVVRSAIADFRRRLRAERYDWVIDCQGLVKSAVVARLAQSTRRAGPNWSSAREPIATLAYDFRAEVPWHWHVVRRNRAVAALALGYPVDEPARFGLQAPALDANWLPGGPYAVLITGASRPQKLWPDPNWIAVAQHLVAAGLQLVWLWGSDDEARRAAALAQAGGGARSVVPPFVTVAEAAGLIARSHLVVGLDTGFTHLAGALGRPTIGIFCDFDAVQCAVSGDAYCASFGGIGQIPAVAEILAAIDRGLESGERILARR